MPVNSEARKRTLGALLSAVFTVFCGLILWKAPVGQAWVNASYDFLFRFGSHTITNDVVAILMDNEAYAHFQQKRGERWDRALHARLLNRLKEDACALVVMDCFLRIPGDPAADDLLAAAMREMPVVLMAEQAAVTHPTLAGAYPVFPAEPFLGAVGTNWGVAWLDPDLDSVVRRHWPFPSPGPYPSLSWTAAQLAGARLDAAPMGRWLRYYRPRSAWTSLGYKVALAQPTNYFRGKIVFIGNEPKTSVPGDEPDEFRTPFTRWTGESMGGMQLILTSFLNLIGNNWLERPVWWIEATLLVVAGMALGWGLCHVRPLAACLLAIAFVLVIALGAVSWSHFSKYWFPWMVIAAGQVPCALLCALATHRTCAPKPALGLVCGPKRPRHSPGANPLESITDDLLNIPNFELVSPPIGQGAYGNVWLAKNRAGEWQALKIVYQRTFKDSAPYEREFNGINRYQRISGKHPGLLRVHFVSPMKSEGFFFYVMELADSIEAGWERALGKYQPLDLVNECRRRPGRRLSLQECVRIGLELADALDFLHRNGLTHRDIKPQNVIFIKGRPKLADMGLVAEIRASDQPITYVGTLNYMPPPPERSGTPQADIYALGMMLYAISTGRPPKVFPVLATSIAETNGLADFLPLNDVIVKACNPECAHRYASARDMHRALLEIVQVPEKQP